MISQNELLSFLDNTLFSPSFSDIDDSLNGLQVRGKTEITKILFAVSANSESILKAKELKADALLVHHGLLWKNAGVQKFDSLFGEKLKILFQNDINLFAYHLPLDAHPSLGHNAIIASLLGLTGQSPFGNYGKKMQTLPIGIKGNFSSPISESSLKEKLEKLTGHPVILASTQKTISSLGIISGGGGSMWNFAKKENLDAFVTGEVSLHHYEDAKENALSLFVCGHNATETFGLLALQKVLEEKFKLSSNFLPSTNPI